MRNDLVNIGATAHSVRRWRLRYAVLAAVVMGAGLVWRSGVLQLPPFGAKYGGDSLWALLVFCGFAFVFHRASTLRLALLALGVAWAIEFSQLYHSAWIDQIRSTRLGALILGATFNWPDLLAYAIGIFAGVLFDSYCAAKTKRRDLGSRAADY